MSSEAGPGPILSAHLGYLLKHAFKRLSDLINEALTPLGLIDREMPVLQLLSEGEPPSQQQVAQRLGIDRTSMVAFLDGLEGKGLVSRKPHPHDRRRNVMELTDAGRAALKAGQQANAEAERTLLAELSAQDAQILRQALRTIVLPPGAAKNSPE